MPSTELSQEWAGRFAPQLGLDPNDALHRLLVERLGGCYESIDPARLVAPLGEETRRNYGQAILNFERWCHFEGYIEALGDAASMPMSALRSAIEEWLVWRVTPITADHPLSLPAAATRGDRGGLGWRTCAPVRRLTNLRAALRWWSACLGLGEIVSARAEQVSAQADPARPSRALTDDEIVQVCELLVGDDVFNCVDAQRQRAWNARQLAVFTISMTASLRRSEVAMLTDANVTTISDDGVTFRLPRTKQHPRGQLIQLFPRDDILCPVGALTRWLTVCAERHWDRGGLLLPVVRTWHVKALGGSGHGHADRMWREVTEHLGITDDIDTGLRSTPHGLRATALTRAVGAGWDPLKLKALGNWSSLSSALRYDRSGGPRNDLVDGAAAELASHTNSLEED